jgi:hypothetical protein
VFLIFLIFYLFLDWCFCCILPVYLGCASLCFNKIRLLITKIIINFGKSNKIFNLDKSLSLFCFHEFISWSRKFFKILTANSYITNLELFQGIHFHLLCVKNLIGSRGVWCFWCFDGDDSRNVSWIDSESFTATCWIYICWYYNSFTGFTLQLQGLLSRVMVNKACTIFGMSYGRYMFY